MTLAKTLQSVNNPITGAQFHIVRNEIPKNEALFIKWSNDVVNRANSGKTVNISIDCEGYFLGSIKQSLSCIQIGEIFNDDFNINENCKPPNVGSKSGFLILSPFTDKIKDCISDILSHTNIIIYTFDFVGDFATMLEAGIKINMANVFDSQVSTLNDNNINYIQNENVKSLSWFVEEAIDYDPLGKKANNVKNKEKRNYFSVTSFLYKDSSNPAIEIITKDLLEMGASDVYMTGLAASYCINNGLTQKVLMKSRLKVYQFCQYINYHNSYLAPSIYRHLFFIDTYSAWKYEKNNVYLNDENESDLLYLLKMFYETYSIINSYKILNFHGLSKISLNKAEIYNQAIVKKLEKNRERLVKMMNDYT